MKKIFLDEERQKLKEESKLAQAKVMKRKKQTVQEKGGGFSFFTSKYSIDKEIRKIQTQKIKSGQAIGYKNIADVPITEEDRTKAEVSYNDSREAEKTQQHENLKMFKTYMQRYDETKTSGDVNEIYNNIIQLMRTKYYKKKNPDKEIFDNLIKSSDISEKDQERLTLIFEGIPASRKDRFDVQLPPSGKKSERVREAAQAPTSGKK